VPAKVGKGWVHVVVQPWGNVWIDDKYMHRAPLDKRLPEGRYVIGAGQKLPTQRRVIDVEAGTRQEIVFTLAE
jgi:hypothetical protein